MSVADVVADRIAREFRFKKPRQRKCKVCRNAFVPRSITHKACSPECGLQIVAAERQKKARAELAERKRKLKTRMDYIREAQTAFNAYIRARDAGLSCICCGKPMQENKHGGSVDCGHYRSTGSAPHLRFNEDNAHAQSKQCNRYGAGRAVDYRIGLIARIGLSRVEALEAENTPRHWTIDELIAIKAEFKARLKALQS